MKNMFKGLNFPRFVAMGILLLACAGLEYYFHMVRGITVIYTHLFYIPIVLAAWWWGLRGGLHISLTLCLIHIVFDLPGLSGSVFLRSLLFIFIGTVIGIISDRKKRADRELKKYAEELEQANIRLQELDRLKSMFIASMSHELRTPLNSIIGFTGIILQGMTGEITEEQRKQLTIVKNSATHLLELINDVIDVSKIEAGKEQLAIAEFDLAALAQEVKNSFTVTAANKGLNISIKIPSTLTIESDKRRTKQVITNLVGNAVKFTDKGKVEINVTKKDGVAEVSVMDTGVGIRREAIEKLFKAFSQILTDGRLYEGTGLGLYLSQKISSRLGGEITVESEFGEGSKFIFTLPLNYKGGNP